MHEWVRTWSWVEDVIFLVGLAVVVLVLLRWVERGFPRGVRDGFGSVRGHVPAHAQRSLRHRPRRAAGGDRGRSLAENGQGRASWRATRKVQAPPPLARARANATRRVQAPRLDLLGRAAVSSPGS